MNKFALLAAAAAFISAPAIAGEQTTTIKTYQTNDGTRVEMRNNSDQYDRYNRYDPRKDETTYKMHMKTNTKMQTQDDMSGNYALIKEGERLIIDGKAAYFVEADGDKYLAPDNEYTTEEGIKFFTEDGTLLRSELPAETVYVDVDEDGVETYTTRKTYHRKTTKDKHMKN